MGGNDEEVTAAARELIRRGAAKVLVTVGSRGCALFVGDAAGKFVATRKVKPVDTTGAGDSFLGALGAKIVAGQNLEEAMAFANEVAAVSVTREGTQKSFPTLCQLNDGEERCTKKART